MIVAIIPARGGSKGIPKKNIIDFCGKPLIAWTIEQAKNSSLIDEVYVSTDDKEIESVSGHYGAKIIKRPSEIAKDKSTSEEALIHAVQEIRKKGNDIEYVVFLQATSPLRKPDDIDNAVRAIRHEKADSLFSGAEIGDFLIWTLKNGKLESLNYYYKDRKPRQEFQKQFVENGSIYIFRPEILFKFNNRFGGKIAMSHMELWQSFEIDDPEDLGTISSLFKIKIMEGQK